jgi:hypothetical protein
MSVAEKKGAFETPGVEVAAIEEALHVLLTAGLDQRRPRIPKAARPPERGFVTVGELLARTRAEGRAESIIRDPIGEVIRIGVKRLGERLYEIGGLDLMGTVLDRVAERDPAASGQRTDIMDKRWDGIGQTDSSPGWMA